MLIVNGLETTVGCFPSDLTFRRRKKWISDIDKCVVSSNLLQSIESFSINKDTNLPSDHAPISITLNLPGYTRSTDKLLDGALNIDAHAILSNVSKLSISKKVIPIKSINSQIFSQSILKTEESVLLSLKSGDPNFAVHAIGVISFYGSQ